MPPRLRRADVRMALRAVVFALVLAQLAGSVGAQPGEQAEGCRAPVLDAQPLPERLQPGQAYQLLFSIENPNSASVDTVRASVTTTAPGGWTATAAQRELTLGARDVAMDVLTLAAPPRGSGETSGNLTIHVTFVCTSAEVQTTASSSMVLEVRAEGFQAPWPVVLAGFMVLAGGVTVLGVRRLSRGVAMGCDAPERLVAPGHSAKFEIHLQNRRGRQQRLHMLATGAPPSWQVHLALDEVVLEPGEEKTVWALLKAPLQAEAGDEAVVTLRLQGLAGRRDGTAIVVRARVTAAS